MQPTPTRIHIATALVRRRSAVLLVASRYPNHAEPVWTLPGGRQQPGELLAQTALRELREETGLTGTVRELAYVSESYDGPVHFTNFTFVVRASGEPVCPAHGDHVAAAAWTPLRALPSRLSVRVVREPLIAYLRGTLPRYAGYAEAGITIVFPD